MKPLSLEEIKKSQVETLLIFRDFCEKNHLKYYLAFGTLLGAVRHKGFIPWDDDIDVFMPREDYNFFIEHFNETIINKREAISKEICPNFYLNIAKIIDRNTALIENGRALEIGVWVDVFPMEYLVNSRKMIETVNRIIRFLTRVQPYTLIQPIKTRNVLKKIIVYVLYVLNVVFRSNKRLKQLIKIIPRCITTNRKSKTYGLLYRSFGEYGVPAIPTHFFEKSVKLEFEGELFNAPREYDTLLRDFYGDYMTLPPKEKQISRHSYTCHWREDISK